MENPAYYNGKITSIEEMMIPMLDRAVYFGDGVYDVTLTFRTHRTNWKGLHGTLP